MKITVERDVLAEAVQWVARYLPARPSLPLLSGVLVTADGEGVQLSGFDYETSARIHIAAEVHDEGTALVSGKLLADISRSLPAKPVNITSDATKMELVCGSARFTLQGMPIDEYPELPVMPQPTGTVASEDFAKAVAQVVVAAGRDELLPVFTGVRVEVLGDQLTLLATDRYRMALKELTWTPAGTDLETAALVPAKVLGDAARSMTSGEQVTISLSDPESGDSMIGLAGSGAAGHREITTRLLDGEFPKGVRSLMGIKPLLSVRLSTAELMEAAKRIALVAERNTSLRMGIGDEEIVLEAATGDQAQGSEAISAAVELHGNAEPALTAAGFNPHYLQDALGILDAPVVDFAFTAPGKPCLMTGVASMDDTPLDDYRHVIMLMRLPQ
ncbi:DNA polymerase III subunit beta [Parenemella sanctibonifatiensis]|uniref:Beta sliding clamp n=1 Tax=Parenemella sanctibonifatiensis TaxID=2016505 RepID=A0A255EFI6_9ACTN|nr:DNA polymerase III subunit beta [Parenemella sanctibonifatiensis]OYN90286.1 DNA polymerase III subunit beta [Parenemella sanctibonifatiensis]OYN90724.1 DNA polymerase III subunit beta [Parenemella sanctibonifatiensis]